MSAPWQPPEFIDEFRLLERLGSGGMGQVYLAHDLVLDRQVALKVLMSVAVDESQWQRFKTEARAIARVKHPNVVEIYRVGEIRRHPYLVSEYLRGRSLDQLKKPLPWQEVLRLGIGLARGLAATHRRGVLHRDIKPANAFLTDDDVVKLLDFGVAKIMDIGMPEPAPLPAVWPRVPLHTPDPGNTTVDIPATPGSARSPDDRPRESPIDPGPASSLVGTPHYLAPELWAGKSASVRSDLYSLGVLLYQLGSGVLPHSTDDIHRLRDAVMGRPATPLQSVAPLVDPAFVSVVNRCLERDPAERYPSADALREELESLQQGSSRPQVSPGDRPYPGLNAFGAEDRASFFGRDAEARAVVDRLRSDPLVVVAGDSGAGKSSLCRAGVLPLVAYGAWTVVEMVPGWRPLEALAGALARALRLSELELLHQVQDSPGALAHRVLAARPNGLLLFVDQLEEMLTLASPEDSERFALALGSLAGGNPKLRVLGTTRGDFLARLASMPGIGGHLSSGLYLLTHLTGSGLRDAIVQPARAHGYAFESEAMVEALAKAGEEEGSLPLLQFALSQLWEVRDRERHLLTSAALDAMGGAEGALARHADKVVETLRPAHRDVARQLLLRLVQVEGTRARRSRSELIAASGAPEKDAAEVLEALVRGRLVLARGTGEDDTATYELTHEALLRRWSTLQDWMSEGKGQRILRQRLEQASAEWERLGRPREYLWKRRQFQEAAKLEGVVLGAVEEAFLAASRRALALQRLVVGSATFLVLLGIGTAFGVDKVQKSRRVNELLAHARSAMVQAVAQRKAAEALRRQAFELFDAEEPGDPSKTVGWSRLNEAESSWKGAAEHATAEVAKYQEAVGALDEALLQTPDRQDVQRELARVLDQYISSAERERQFERRDTLEQRRAGLEPPPASALAQLTIESEPAGANLTLEQAKDQRGWTDPVPFGTTPLRDHALPAGSYRLSLTVQGRPTLLVPLLLARRERYHLALSIPAALPDGYAYVPPGRFLHGSPDSDRRRVYDALPPIHELTTPGFLIAKHEVTYADWLAFLRALPPEERERRRPRDANHYSGTIHLENRAGVWVFTMSRPLVDKYEVEEGKRIHYKKRNKLADQDWLRFPVSSILYDDAQAYLRWLRDTRHLRGARMCSRLEWERAARGADERDFPHGNDQAPDDANFDETYGREPAAFGPDEVGSHPASDSPFGISDMSGNVAEWLRGAVQAPGSFYSQRTMGFTFNYNPGGLTLRSPLLGLRVCADDPTTTTP